MEEDRRGWLCGQCQTRDRDRKRTGESPMKPKANGFLAILDSNDTIIHFVTSHQINPHPEGKPFISIVLPHSREIAFQLLKQLHEEGSALDYVIATQISGDSARFMIHGFQNQDQAVLIGIDEQSSGTSIFHEFVRMSNAQVNEIRKLRQRIQLSDSGVYEEMSKLNSELLNSRRIIEKQNAELTRYNHLLHEMAITDGLTGAFNRRYFYEYFHTRISSSPSIQSACLVMIDFNDFKSVNDRYGHDAGDKLLIDFVRLAKDITKSRVEVFRLGGDEFIILLFNPETDDGLSLIDSLNERFDAISPVASLAYGAISFETQSVTRDYELSEIMNQADQKMYRDKMQKKETKKSPIR
jgi:diguanylate cyclase (GGDEF)-like protein